VAEGVRDRMVRSAVVQLARRGLAGASFAEVLEHANAPRGSVYHHFPAGKQELVTAALDYMASDALRSFDNMDGAPVSKLIDRFIAMWQTILERSDFNAGCSVVAVTVTADDRALIEGAAAVFRAWHARLTERLHTAGLARREASSFATMMIAAAEGAVVLARAQRDLEPLKTVHRQLLMLAQSHCTTSRKR